MSFANRTRNTLTRLFAPVAVALLTASSAQAATHTVSLSGGIAEDLAYGGTAASWSAVFELSTQILPSQGPNPFGTQGGTQRTWSAFRPLGVATFTLRSGTGRILFQSIGQSGLIMQDAAATETVFEDFVVLSVNCRTNLCTTVNTIDTALKPSSINLRFRSGAADVIDGSNVIDFLTADYDLLSANNDLPRNGPDSVVNPFISFAPPTSNPAGTGGIQGTFDQIEVAPIPLSSAGLFLVSALILTGAARRWGPLAQTS